jgi:hypothetical protein
LENKLIDLDESLARLRQFQTCLNRPEVLPERAFRREGRNYELVSYINNISGLLLSLNFEAIPNFVARAAEHMVEVPATTPNCEQYYSIVSDYLSHVVFHLISFASGAGSFDDSRISLSILAGGPRQPPNIKLQRTPDGTVE